MRLAELRSRWLCWRQKPDLAYSREPNLALAAARAGFGVILEPHALPRTGSRNSTALAALLKHPNLRRVAAISRALLHDILTEYGETHAEADSIVAHDAADVGGEPSRAPENRPLRVGYFGHLYPGKGMETIVELAEQAPHVHFDIYGGQDADLDRWRSLTAGMDNLILHGHIFHSEVRSHAEQCDILLAPYAARVDDVSGRDISRWMSPLKIFEYMAAARAIIASDLPVLREILRDEHNALLCRASDAGEWLKAINRLEQDTSLRLSIGERARQDVVREHSWEKRASLVLEGIDAPDAH
jgi:glycosyltransferase involved in cell wall biosynthesis